MSKISTVRVHLVRQPDVKSATVVVRLGRRVVKAVVENELHDGSMYRRTVFYDENGNQIR